MEDLGEGRTLPSYTEQSEENMYTISNIIEDIDRGCAANNMQEDRFSYRIIYFVNEGDNGSKHHLDTPYGGLRNALEDIIRNNLTLTNSIVIAETTVLKGGRCICLQDRAYLFSLDGYFKQINGESQGRNGNGNIMYGRYAVK